MYPQLPVLNYFIDFANPYYKIGLELDGKDFHDTEKDRIRDQHLYDNGWRIFRISGSEMMRKFTSRCELFESGADKDTIYKETEKWIMNTGDGVIASINSFFFRKYNLLMDDEMRLVYRTLESHNLIKFDIWDDI